MKPFAIILALSLAGCSTGGHDRVGNEAPAFDVTKGHEPDGIVKHYAANSSSELITYCHDQHGFISGDGYSCAIYASYPMAPAWCVKAIVRGHDGDEEWMNAVCDGWNPTEN